MQSVRIVAPEHMSPKLPSAPPLVILIVVSYVIRFVTAYHARFFINIRDKVWTGVHGVLIA